MSDERKNPIKSDRLPNGYFAKGNKISRMKKKGFTLADLNKAAYEYGKTKKKDILEHYIQQCFRDNRLLQNFVEKNVPTKTIQELTGKDGTPLNFTIEKTYQKGQDDKK